MISKTLIVGYHETGRTGILPVFECTGRMPMPLTFHVGNRGTGNRGTDKNAPPLSCGRDAHAPFYCCPQRSAGILPNATNFSCRQQGHGQQRDRQKCPSSFMRAGRPRSLLLLPSKERGHLARRSRDGSATLLLWERRRPRRQERWRGRSRPTGTSAFPGDNSFFYNMLTPKIKKKRAVKSEWHWARCCAPIDSQIVCPSIH